MVVRVRAVPVGVELEDGLCGWSCARAFPWLGEETGNATDRLQEKVGRVHYVVEIREN